MRAYYDGWGNICNGGYYGLAEADVICHQLGYTGASSYSNAGQNKYATHNNHTYINLLML